MKDIHLVGIAGWDESGKTTLANLMLKKVDYRCAEVSPVVMKIATHLGWNGTKDDSPKGRPLLVRTGEMIKEEFGESYLINLVIDKEIEEGCSNIVIPSIRTTGEALWIRERGGVVIKVTRSQSEKITNPKYVKEFHRMSADYVIMNNGTLDDFLDKCFQTIQERCETGY